jgi:hypothetical protein
VNTNTLIDAVLREYDYSESSADVSDVRLKLLDKAQEVSDEDWEEFDGVSWQTKAGTVSLTSGSNSVAVPTDFWKCGDSGGVFVQVTTDDIRKLTYLPPGELRQMQRENGTTTGIPAYYSIFTVEGTTDILQLIQVDVKADATYSLLVDYVMVGPTLADNDSATTSNLQYWPTQLHSMLLKGLLARGSRIMGDTVRQSQHEAEHQKRLAAAIARWKHGQDDDERSGRGGYSAWRQW